MSFVRIGLTCVRSLTAPDEKLASGLDPGTPDAVDNRSAEGGTPLDIDGSVKPQKGASGTRVGDGEVGMRGKYEALGVDGYYIKEVDRVRFRVYGTD